MGNEVDPAQKREGKYGGKSKEYFFGENSVQTIYLTEIRQMYVKIGTSLIEFISAPSSILYIFFNEFEIVV